MSADPARAALRRMLSDGPLTGWPRRPSDREKNGSGYRANPEPPRDADAVDPAQVLAQMGDERAARKRSHPGSAS